MKITEVCKADRVEITLYGVLEARDYMQLKQLIENAFDQTKTVLLDLKNYLSTDTIFLAVCINAAQQAKLKQLKFALVNPTPQLQKLKSLFRLDGILATS